MARRILERLFDIVRQSMCGLHGHDSLLHFETSRLSMRCTTCGYQTPGWDLKAAVPRSQPKPRVLRLPLVREQRVA